MQFSRSGLIILMVMVFAFGAWGQNSQAGIPSFSSQWRSVNLSNLNYGLPVKVLSKQGRGIPIDYALHYNSTIYAVATDPAGSGQTFFVIPGPGVGGESKFGWSTNGLGFPNLPPFDIGSFALNQTSFTYGAFNGAFQAQTTLPDTQVGTNHNPP